MNYLIIICQLNGQIHRGQAINLISKIPLQPHQYLPNLSLHKHPKLKHLTPAKTSIYFKTTSSAQTLIFHQTATQRELEVKIKTLKKVPVKFFNHHFTFSVKRTTTKPQVQQIIKTNKSKINFIKINKIETIHLLITLKNS